MEVVGLVLGGIPLAISALQHYQSFFNSFKTAQRELDSIIRGLRTQQRILENTCEKLLQGIIPPSDIEIMIQKPLDPLWTQHEEHIKLRLDQDWEAFRDTAQEMENIVRDLQAKLALDENGKPTLRDQASFIVALKERVRFTLRSKDYRSLIQALMEGNNSLCTLLSQSKNLEPFRQARVRIRFIQAAQKVTEEIYNSLNACLICPCAGGHRFGIALSSRKSALIHMAHGRHAAKTTYGIAFGSNRGDLAERWDQFHVSFANDSNGPPSVPLMPKGHFSSKGSSSIRGITSTGAVPAIPNQTLTTTCLEFRPSHTSYEAPTGAKDRTSQIRDLCVEFVKGNVKGKETVKVGCFGFVPYKENRFYLFHETCNPAGSTFVTLKEILSGNHSQLPMLDYSQKVKIAYMLSSNLLPIVTTPWLGKALNLDQIAFLSVEEGVEGVVYHLDRPYLAKGLLTSPSTPDLSCGHSSHLPSAKYKPLTILSLACLLVQIILGQSMEEFNIRDRSCLGCLMAQQAAASRKVGAILAKTGDMYADAVNWCLENFLSAINLDDEEFTHRYYSTVVAKLEELADIVEYFSSS